MWQGIIGTLTTTVTGAIIGGALVHFFAVRRDVAIKRREIILPNLIAALQVVEEANSQKKEHSIKSLEAAVWRIEMLGDVELIKISHAMISEIATTGKSGTTELYFALRDRIRSELKLKPIPHEYMSLAITLHDNSKTELPPSTNSKSQL